MRIYAKNESGEFLVQDLNQLERIIYYGGYVSRIENEVSRGIEITYFDPPGKQNPRRIIKLKDEQ